MQVKKTTTTITVVAVASLLFLLITMISSSTIFPTTNVVAVYAQESDEEEETETVEEVEGTISAEEVEEEEDSDNNNQTTTTSSSPQTYQDVSRAEVIDNSGNIQNPGGAGNENINLTTTIATAATEDDNIMTRPTNLEEMVVPQSIQSQNYQDIKIALQAAGYSISDMQYTLEYGTGIPVIIVRGVEGVMSQPNMMDLESVGAAYGFALRTHLPIDGAWQTTFESVTGSQVIN